ncbi:class I SAM-dependent methyltransferase [Proteiniphilum sp. UBA5384]|uniref:class I SAM-dependent methyltransferase n=1 Tax=Proteiniphilum sp. UBA5384 TaxID=1947279 RepID=UPI0025CE40C8|nr:class I SAM-dependent methyltransferase [Proteiniphilum sp. UBA5384]
MTTITLMKCPVCGAGNLKKIFDAADHFSSGEMFPIYDCDHCGFRFTNHFPSEDTIGRYYDSPNYISHSDSNEGLVNRLYHHFRKRMLRKKVSLVASYVPEKDSPIRLLDIGCGTGYFLQAAKERGWIVSGIEKDEKARENAAIRSGLPVHDENNLWEIKNSSYNVVTLWHVLEHLEKLNETIQKIKEIITPEGIVVLALPNCRSYDARFYKKWWAAYDIPRHLWHFSPGPLEKLLDKHGLKVIQKVCMPLDAFYISLLSEKYKGSNFFIRYGRAFGIGTIGFLCSLGNIEQSSSIIYIAKIKENKSKPDNGNL